MTQIQFTATKAEIETIHHIAQRAHNYSLSDKFVNTMMDIEACHCNGTPLELERLLSARLVDFFHDVDGIRNHINRETGKLENCFMPRFAVKQGKEVAA
ncbi:MAG TPA: hypothetical protein VIY48_13340 [Candidatus Paceibacterota bacterium]